MNNPHPPFKGRILTGHRPTGPRHIGHLVGTMDNWVNLQDSYECFFLIADLHVLTTDYEHPARIQKNILEVLADWLAAGINPDRATLVLQSAIPAHSQLSLLFSMLVTVSRMNRVPTYKEQVKELHLQPSLGLLTYPTLQAADILIYKADAVPVGEDQLPHIELTREVARRFNQVYGNILPEPEALLSPTPRLPGIDNRTMHTSYGNAIFLRETPEETIQKVKSMYTDIFDREKAQKKKEQEAKYAPLYVEMGKIALPKNNENPDDEKCKQLLAKSKANSFYSKDPEDSGLNLASASACAEIEKEAEKICDHHFTTRFWESYTGDARLKLDRDVSCEKCGFHHRDTVEEQAEARWF